MKFKELSDGARQELARELVARDVIQCVSMEVGFFISCALNGCLPDENPIDVDQVYEAFSKCETFWDEKTNTEYTRSELEDEIEKAHEKEKWGRHGRLENILENGPTGQDEIFEWWAVSSFLARDLEARGHIILDGPMVKWWGRQCTGQAIALDYDIQRIAFDLWGETDPFGIIRQDRDVTNAQQVLEAALKDDVKVDYSQLVDLMADNFKNWDLDYCRRIAHKLDLGRVGK